MTLPAIQQEIHKIDDLFDLVDGIQKAPGVPFPLATAAAAHLTQYICVRVAGFIEQSAREIYRAYALGRAGQSPLTRFVSTALERQQNLNAERLYQLAGRFDSNWEADLRVFMNEERKEALASILRNRHKIAHGDAVSLGVVQMKDWYKRVVEVVAFLEEQAGA